MFFVVSTEKGESSILALPLDHSTALIDIALLWRGDARRLSFLRCDTTHTEKKKSVNVKKKEICKNQKVSEKNRRPFSFPSIQLHPSTHPLFSTRDVIRGKCAVSGKENAEKIITLCINQLVCS